MTAVGLANLFGSIVGGLLIFAIGYWISLSIRARRKAEFLPKLPMIVAGGIGALGTLSAFTHGKPASSVVAEIEPAIVRQDAPHMTGADITPEYASAVQKFIIENFKTTKAFGVMKMEPGAVSVVTVNDRPIAIIRLSVDGEDTIVSMVGMQSSQLVRVTCAVDHGRVDYHSALCARAVRQNLGVTLP